MKTLLSLAVLLALVGATSSAYAENKADRPGGYNEQVANKKSLASTNGCDVGLVYVHQQCVCVH